MKNKKILTICFWLSIIVLAAVAGLIIWEYYDTVPDVIEKVTGYCFSILGILITIFVSQLQMISRQKDESESSHRKAKHNKLGNIIIPFLMVSLFFVLLSFLFDFVLYLKWGIGVFVLCAILTIILGSLSKQSLRGQENSIVEPEKFWRVFWNMLPSRFGYERNPILNVLIIHSAEGADQAKQMRQKYEQTKNELWIDLHSCIGNNKEQLENRLTTRNYIGIHLIYTEDIKSEMPWVRELCYEWSLNNKSKPIVYTNCTSENHPLNYGTSNKDSDAILRLFQRTHTLSELWREQANIQHKSFMGLSFFFAALIAGLISLLVFDRLNNSKQMNIEPIVEQIVERINIEPIVLVGGGTVKEYIEKEIDPNYPTDNLLFIPMPTGLGCGQLGDEGFIKQLRGNVIIMSSERQEKDSVFRLFNHDLMQNILEVYLRTDTFYIKSRNINWNDKDTAISLENLTKKINADNDVKIIFHTNVNSGTYNFYKPLIDSVKKDKKPYYAGKMATNFTQIYNYIILTRSFYDPIPNSGKKIKKIDILTKVDSIATGDLFLYIPITQKEVKEGDKYEIPDHIYEFLGAIRKKYFPPIHDIVNDETIIRDTSYKSKQTNILKI
ncbi:MAG: hypothetical protein FWF09_00725 [Bacteroidales bacterium]|nr:hypothetical protein [Bacteroidales bacterium]